MQVANRFSNAKHVIHSKSYTACHSHFSLGRSADCLTLIVLCRFFAATYPDLLISVFKFVQSACPSDVQPMLLRASKVGSLGSGVRSQPRSEGGSALTAVAASMPPSRPPSGSVSWRHSPPEATGSATQGTISHRVRPEAQTTAGRGQQEPQASSQQSQQSLGTPAGPPAGAQSLAPHVLRGFPATSSPGPHQQRQGRPAQGSRGDPVRQAAMQHQVPPMPRLRLSCLV